MLAQCCPIGELLLRTALAALQSKPDGPHVVQGYNAVPVEQFGAALLRGMGWKDGKGIGWRKELVKPVEYKRRAPGLGLGAGDEAGTGTARSLARIALL